MCIMLHIAAIKPLRYWEWRRPSPILEVWGPHDDNLYLKGIFSKPHVYSVATTFTADGCGFQYPEQPGQAAREALAAFLERALLEVPELDLFVAYYDTETQGEDPWSYDWIGPSDIRTWRSRFNSNEFLTIIRED